MPLFSIVMPTRNRANLLRFALQSALAQTFADYEIVISDNQSSDNTPEVVRGFPDPRVRYFRTEKVLPMHENWEFAFGKAQGEWITFLCDDDAFRPGLLATVQQIFSQQDTSIITWPPGYYFLDTYPLQQRRGQLHVFSAAGHVEKRASRRDLLRLFELRRDIQPMIPRILNSCAHRKLIEEVQRRVGRFFLPPAPDYSGGSALLALTDSYIHIEAPLGINGMGAHVIGFSPTYNQLTSHVHFVEDFQGEPIFRWVPMDIMTEMNSIADSILAVKHAMPEKLTDCEIDWPRYFAECYLDIMRIGQMGSDISSMKQHWFGGLSHQPLSFRARVGAVLARRPKDILSDLLGLRGMVSRSRVLYSLLALSRHQQTFDGSRFGNILGAVEHLERSAPLPPMVFANHD